MSFGRAYRIAIDAAGFDLGSPAPFDGVIEPDHDRGAGRHQSLYQQHQQLTRRGPGRPLCPIKDTVEGTEVGIAFASQDAQRRRDGSPTWRQNDACEQHQNVCPRSTCEQFSEPHEPRQKSFRQRRPRRVGEKMRVLHLIGRIGALNRDNLTPVRQIESACSPRPRLCGTPAAY